MTHETDQGPARDTGGLREALEAVVALLDRLDAQARDGGGARREVYVTVETWRDVFQPARRKALAALSQGAAHEERGLDVPRLRTAMAKQLSGLITTGMAEDVAAEYARCGHPGGSARGTAAMNRHGISLNPTAEEPER